MPARDGVAPVLDPSASSSERSRRLIAGYLIAQAVLGVLWWSALLSAPTVRDWFDLVPTRRSGLDAFALADAAVFIGGSSVSAWAVWTGSRWSTLATSFTVGGIAYATLYLLNWVVLEGTGAAGLAPMGVALILTSVIAVRTSAKERP